MARQSRFTLSDVDADLAVPRKLAKPVPRRAKGQSVAQFIVRWFFRVAFTLMFRIRVHGLRNYPARDGALICANHLSHLDPLVLGAICPRPINYLGRKTLFRFKPLAWFLTWNDTIPIDRDGGSLSGLKETLRRLKRKESVLIFPEGTRSPDGELQSLKLGFCSVARRAEATLVPIAMAGPYEALPRQRWQLRPVRIHVVIGKPILFREYRQLEDEDVGELLTRHLLACINEVRERRRPKRLF